MTLLTPVDTASRLIQQLLDCPRWLVEVETTVITYLSFPAFIIGSSSLKFNRYSEFIIYDNQGEECQRFIIDIPWYRSLHPLTGLYNHLTDDVIFIYPMRGIFYVIPKIRLKTSLLWHEYYTHINGTPTLLQTKGPSKIWFIGGFGGVQLGEDRDILRHTGATKIYDIE